MKQITEITASTLKKIVEGIKNGLPEAEQYLGSYLYKGFQMQISEYQADGNARFNRFYHKRRRLGLCVICGKQVETTNPRTKKLYRFCDDHREKIDHRNKKIKSEKAAKPVTEKKAAKKTAGKKTAKKAAVKKTAVKKVAKKTSAKTTVKKAAAKKTTTKKTAKKQ